MLFMLMFKMSLFFLLISFLLPDDAIELFVVDLEDDLLLDALLVNELSFVDFVLVLFVLDVLLSPAGDAADHDVPEELAGHDGDLVVHLDVHCRCQLPCSR